MQYDTFFQSRWSLRGKGANCESYFQSKFLLQISQLFALSRFQRSIILQEPHSNVFSLYEGNLTNTNKDKCLILFLKQSPEKVLKSYNQISKNF